MRSSFRLPRVYPITDREISGLSHAEQVARFAAGGATLVQLRDKHASPVEFYEQAQAALEIANERGVQLIINDRVDIALALGTGVHLGQDDLPPEAARRLVGDDAIIGYSTHSLSQIQQAATLPVDYFAIGPIFPTSTKDNPDPVVGLDGVRSARQALGRQSQLVAIGGISEVNAREVIEAGADSVALIQALLADPQRIPQTVRALFTALTTQR